MTEHSQTIGNLFFGIGWEIEQLVKSGLFSDEQEVIWGALRALFQLNPQTRIKMVTTAYANGDIGLGKAAAMMGVSQEEMKDILRESGCPIHGGPLTRDELLDDAHNA